MFLNQNKRKARAKKRKMPRCLLIKYLISRVSLIFFQLFVINPDLLRSIFQADRRS